MKVLDLSSNKISKIGLKVFKNRMNFFPSLKVLSLASIYIIINYICVIIIENLIDDKGFDELSECFSDLKCLEILDISNCVIKHADERIAVLENLKELHLENNRLSNECKEELPKLLSNLKELNIAF